LDTAYTELPLSDAARGAPLLPLRSVLVLGALILCEALAACWLVLQPGSAVPLAGVVPVNLVPNFLCGMALALAIFAAPFFSTQQPEPRALALARGGTVALCQALALSYLLLVSSRLTPVEGERIFTAGAWISLCALCAILLAQALPRAFTGLMFVWMIALPVLAYILAELFVSRGNVAWAQARGTPLYSAVHWILAVSPATATSAIIDQTMPDGSGPGMTPWILVSSVAAAAFAMCGTGRVVSARVNAQKKPTVRSLRHRSDERK